MAVSHNTYFPRAHEPTWRLSTQEEVSLKVNTDIFLPDGRLKGQARFSADRDHQLFTLSWPKLAVRCVSTLSRWRLVITKATDDRIASFNYSTAENMGTNQWEVVKKVVEDCRDKFCARLLSMSCREIVFSHEDRQSAEKMKDSNEMVDIMNSLLADVEFLYRDIMVDWEVELTPVTVSLSYQPVVDTEEQDGHLGSLILMDADSPPAVQSALSGTSLLGEGVPPYVQRLFNLMVAESRKTQEALDKMAAENANRHRIVCQKFEELKSAVRYQDPGHLSNEENLNGMDSDRNHLNDSAQVYNTQEEDSIPSAQLFEGPEPHEKPANTHHSAAGTEHPPRQSQHEQRHSSEPHSQGSTTQQRQHDQTPPKRESSSDFLRKDPVKPSESFRDSISGSDMEKRNLDEAVERAYRHDEVTPPRAKSHCTMLCLDVSESMKKKGSFEEMKQLVEDFIDGVEDMVSSSGVEENIGVVTFGGTSNVVQNLTNDFSRVRDAIDKLQPGGRSPFVQALLVSMAAFVEKAGVICVSGVYDVRPRIIFISDGYPTENTDDGGLDFAYNKMHVRSGLTRLMVDFAKKDKYRKVHPVVYVPVGHDPDKDLMRSMATLSEGVYLEPADFPKLFRYFLVQETVGKILVCLEDGEQKTETEPHIKAMTTGLAPDLEDEDKEEVVKLVMKEQATPASEKSKRIRSRKSNMEDKYENTEKVMAGEMLPLGTRVLRGPDWHWGNQDGGGPGTVISHAEKNDWTCVYWDLTGQHNRYCYGPNIGYDIWKTDQHPLLMGEDQEMKIGMTVKKGPDWCYQHQVSLRDVKTGIIIRKSSSKRKLMVRWDNAELQVVRWGVEDKFDVMYCDPFEVPVQAPLEFRSANATTAMPSHYHTPDAAPPKVQDKPSMPAMDGPGFENGKWQWRDDHTQWVDYSPEHSAHIDKSYKKKPDGSCIITREGQNRRIMFRRMAEKVVDGGVECAVRRIPA